MSYGTIVVRVATSCTDTVWPENQESIPAHHLLEANYNRHQRSIRSRRLLHSRRDWRYVSLLEIPPSVIDSFQNGVEKIRSFSNWWINSLLTDTNLSTESLNGVSIFMLLLLRLSAIIAKFIKAASVGTNLFHLMSSFQIFWLFPVMAVFGAISFILSMLVKWSSDEAIILMALASLVLVECLFPFSVAICASIAFAKSMNWESALILCTAIYLAASLSSQCFRRVISYPGRL